MELFDTHSHLAMLKHDSLDAILKRARSEGVQRLVSVSVDESSWDLNEKLATSDPNIYFTLGIHPHDAKDFSGCADRIRRRLKNSPLAEKCVGIGETGLDYHYNYSTKEQQLEALESQVQLAKELDLPLVIHCRDAFDDLYSLLKRVGMSKRGGVMHCFTGNPTRAVEAIDLGLWISFSGILTFKNATDIQEAAKKIPLEKIVVETDCPFLAPIPLRGKPNEPSYLTHTVLALSTLRGKPLHEIAQATTENALRLFALGSNFSK